MTNLLLIFFFDVMVFTGGYFIMRLSPKKQYPSLAVPLACLIFTLILLYPSYAKHNWFPVWIHLNMAPRWSILFLNIPAIALFGIQHKKRRAIQQEEELSKISIQDTNF